MFNRERLGKYVLKRQVGVLIFNWAFGILNAVLTAACPPHVTPPPLMRGKGMRREGDPTLGGAAS